MSREELLELIAQMEQERLKLVQKAEKAEAAVKVWEELWFRDARADKVDKVDKL